MTVFCIGVFVAGLITGDEVCAAVCLLIAVTLPLGKLGFKWLAVVKRETRRIGPCIGEEGFYE